MKIFYGLMKYLSIKAKERKIANKNYRLKTFILKLFLFLSMLEISINSEIHLVIQGSGKQKLLSDYFYIEPSEVLVNGVKDDSCKKTCNLVGYKNNITLKFDTQIESCSSMFSYLDNIIEIDLSNFYASKVIDMGWMFSDCIFLEKIEFGNINTPSLINMKAMFQSCSKLKSVDFSKFDTSKVTDMSFLLSVCSNLEKIEFGNVDTSSVEKMDWLFQWCSSLKSIDLSKFDTSKVITMEGMFIHCRSLIYLNLKSFKLKNSVNKNYVFNYISSYVKYCIEDSETKNFLGIQSDCSNDCFKENMKIDIENKICIDSCLKNGYKYEYNNICLNECPSGTYYTFCDIIDCYDETPEGYYLDSNNKTYKKCYEKCKYCYGEGNEIINNCIECISNLTLYNNSMNIMNYYEKFSYYHYFDKTNTFHCTNNNKCP